MAAAPQLVELPPPALAGELALEQLLAQRRSVRDFSGSALALADLGQLLWAAQGITGPDGRRTAPSAGATYPLELYIVAGAVDGLAPGLYHYEPDGHLLARRSTGDVRRPLARAAFGQSWLADAPAVLIFTAVFERTAARYGDRADRYVPMEAGHAAQNVLLQAEALTLGAVVVGAFDDGEVSRVLGIPRESRALSLVAAGTRKEE